MFVRKSYLRRDGAPQASESAVSDSDHGKHLWVPEQSLRRRLF